MANNYLRRVFEALASYLSCSTDLARWDLNSYAQWIILLLSQFIERRFTGSRNVKAEAESGSSGSG